MDRLPEKGGTIRVPAGTHRLEDTATKALKEGQHLHLEGEGTPRDHCRDMIINANYLHAAVAAGCLVAACGSGGRSGAAAGPCAAGGECPTCGEPAAVGRIEDGRITECSGLAWSRTQPILWLHNDSGDVARFYGVDESGALLAVVRLAGATARDWEDMALGPWPDGGDALYLGDIGDNTGSRRTIRVYRVREPAIDPTAAAVDTAVSTYDVIELVYPDGAHDAEALLVDPESGDLYVITKEGDGRSTVFRAVAPAGGEPKELAVVASLGFGTDSLPGSRLATGGDVAPDGCEVIVRTYDRAVVFRRLPGEPLAACFATEPCSVPLAHELQGEAVAYTADGSGYVTVAEGARPAIYQVECSRR